MLFVQKAFIAAQKECAIAVVFSQNSHSPLKNTNIGPLNTNSGCGKVRFADYISDKTAFTLHHSFY